VVQLQLQILAVASVVAGSVEGSEKEQVRLRVGVQE